jgi:D-lactate dehydrogenase (cytochrome)
VGRSCLFNFVAAEKPRIDSVESNIEKTTDPKVLESYFTDESRILVGYAKEVYFPTTEEQIAKILKEADKKGIRVTISGGGTGITGSRVPQGGIVLSTEKLTNLLGFEENLVKYEENGIKYSVCIAFDVDTNEHYAIAPPGIPLDIFQKIVQSEGYFYPPDPTETTALLGGTVATNASGARTFKYGPTRDYVRRIRIVLTNGDVLDIKRNLVHANEDGIFVIMFTSGKKAEIKLPSCTMPNVKNAAGYYVKPRMDLIDLFIGSEGTLGAISEVEFRLVQPPKAIISIFAYFSKEEDSLRFAKKLRKQAKLGKINVLSIEFFDKNSLDFIGATHPPSKIPEKSQGLIFFEQEIPQQEEISEFLKQTVSLLETCNVLETMASLDPDWKKQSKEIRHALPEQVNSFVRAHGTNKVATDIAVPYDALDLMMASYHEVGNGSAMPYVIFGHIGDANLHFNFLPKNQQELTRARKACTTLLKRAIELDGTISGEHGVGKKTYIENEAEKPYLELMYGKDCLLSSARMKHSLDPNHILNIGNIVPAECE